MLKKSQNYARNKMAENHIYYDFELENLEQFNSFYLF